MDKGIFTELKEVLIKKAKGFYYCEETVEFTETSSGKSVNVIETEDGIKVIGVKRKRGRPKKIMSKPVTLSAENPNLGVDLSQKEGTNASKQENVVVKRKITTHYVPPDMLAIKMLFENFGEKVDDIENMSDEEILNLKRKLMREWEEESAGK